MVNKWEVGQLYVFKQNGTTSDIFFSLDWTKNTTRSRNTTFVLLERPRSENVPKGLPSRPWGSWGKVLFSDGEIFWARLERHDCCVLSKKWLRSNPENLTELSHG